MNPNHVFFLLFKYDSHPTISGMISSGRSTMHQMKMRRTYRRINIRRMYATPTPMDRNGRSKDKFLPLTITLKWNPIHNLFHFLWVYYQIPFLKNIFASKPDKPLKSYHSSWRRVQDWQFKPSEMLKQWAFPLIHIPIYSLNFDLPLLLGHVILFWRLRLGLGITSRIWGYTLPSTGAESISLWFLNHLIL